MNRDSSTDTRSSRATQAAGSRSVTAQLTGAGVGGGGWGGGVSREEVGVGGRGVCTLTVLPLLYSKNNTIKK